MKTSWFPIACTLLTLVGPALAVGDGMQSPPREKFRSDPGRSQNQGAWSRPDAEALRAQRAQLQLERQVQRQQERQQERQLIRQQEREQLRAMRQGEGALNAQRAERDAAAKTGGALPEAAEEAQRVARERQLERRAQLRRQINEARDLYPPSGKP